MERRRHNRTPFQAKVDLSYDNTAATASGFSTDLARDGMFVAVSEPPPQGTLLRFRLSYNDGSLIIHGRGEVIWVRSSDSGPARPSGIAIRFLQLADEYQARLDKALAELSPDQLDPDLDTEPVSGWLGALNVGEVELAHDPQVSDPLSANEPSNDISESKTTDRDSQLIRQSAAIRAGLIEPTKPVKPRSPVLMWTLFIIVTVAVASFAVVGPRVLGPPWQWFAATESQGDPGTTGTEIPEGQDQAAKRATELSSIKTETIDQSSEVLVTLTGNGYFSPAQVRHFSMVDPPRIVICLSGITRPYHLQSLATDSPMLKRVRFGLHQEVTPPELTVVLDLRSEQVTAHDLSVSDRVVSLRLTVDSGTTS